MSRVKTVSIPIEPIHKLAKSTTLFSMPDCYRRLIGKVIYITLTHPELAYAIYTMDQFMQTPRTDH